MMTKKASPQCIVKNANRSVQIRVDVGKVKTNKSRCNKKKVRVHLKRHVVQVVFGTLQKLFDACKLVFNYFPDGSVPSPDDVQMLCHILDGMHLEDVGLSKDLKFFRPKNNVSERTPPRVSSATIYKCKNFELSIFFLPENAVIPLHNHPEMTVFSKLLIGTMHIKSYDWVDQTSRASDHQSVPVKLAKLKTNRNFTAPYCDTCVLYPTSGGNIHEFRAVTPCAVLDVIGPPYSKEDGRDCSYYREGLVDHRQTLLQCGSYKFKDDDDGYAWLEEVDEIPKESEMDSIEYMGPQIIDSTS